MLLLGGISGAGMTTFVSDYRPIFMAVTFGFLGFAFYVTYRPRRGTGSPTGRRSKMMAFNKLMLWTATIVAVVFLFFPQSFTNVVAANDEFTADMDRTVLTVEGMT